MKKDPEVLDPAYIVMALGLCVTTRGSTWTRHERPVLQADVSWITLQSSGLLSNHEHQSDSQITQYSSVKHRLPRGDVAQLTEAHALCTL